MAAPSFETLLYAVEDGIATITLNRPEKLNAFTARMMKELIDVFDLTDNDDAVRVVIVTGAGRAFCAGADLSGGGATFDRTNPQALEREEGKVGDIYRDGGGRVVLRMYESLKPIIAAVNGAAVGVGVTMQLPMDIRLASTDAKADDHFFTGFPSYWNIVALYLFAAELPQAANAAILLMLSALVFVRIGYVYPTRTPDLRVLTLGLGAAWALMLFAIILLMPEVPRLLLLVSLFFPVYYTVLSLVLQGRRRKV